MPVKAPGSDWDVNGCIQSAGYLWCEILGKCLRSWEHVCEYPTNCLTWNDGCNTCSLVEGQTGMELGACTEMYCFQQGMPYCLVPAPEVSIEPWLMKPPEPPVINPFLGHGH
tara:strand:+ start:1358 stop:1693 length:336 start_codon:yes stop_codon:yes gene_type:complete